MHEPDEQDHPEAAAGPLGGRSLRDFFTAVAEMALKSAPRADGCGITLQQYGRPATVATAGRSAPRMDEKQYAAGEGPCLQALYSGREVMVTDMLTERRWGDYPAYAAASGTHASLSLPVAAHTYWAGAMNLYAPCPDAFSRAEVTALRSIASHVTGVISGARSNGRVRGPAGEDLRAALASRAAIDRSIGVVMAQRRCGAGEALEMLHAASRSRDVTLSEVSAELVAAYETRRDDHG